MLLQICGEESLIRGARRNDGLPQQILQCLGMKCAVGNIGLLQHAAKEDTVLEYKDLIGFTSIQQSPEARYHLLFCSDSLVLEKAI